MEDNDYAATCLDTFDDFIGNNTSSIEVRIELATALTEMMDIKDLSGRAGKLLVAVDASMKEDMGEDFYDMLSKKTTPEFAIDRCLAEPEEGPEINKELLLRMETENPDFFTELVTEHGPEILEDLETLAGPEFRKRIEVLIYS